LQKIVLLFGLFYEPIKISIFSRIWVCTRKTDRKKERKKERKKRKKERYFVFAKIVVIKD
jgi:hypothetical protein